MHEYWPVTLIRVELSRTNLAPRSHTSEGFLTRRRYSQAGLVRKGTWMGSEGVSEQNEKDTPGLNRPSRARAPREDRIKFVTVLRENGPFVAHACVVGP